MTSTQHRRPKFSVQKATMDLTSKIREVVNHTLCEKHGAIRHGQPCWWIRNDNGQPRAAVCGQRSRKIYTGQVSASSFDRRSKPTNRYPKKESNR